MSLCETLFRYDFFLVLSRWNNVANQVQNHLTFKCMSAVYHISGCVLSLFLNSNVKVNPVRYTKKQNVLCNLTGFFFLSAKKICHVSASSWEITKECHYLSLLHWKCLFVSGLQCQTKDECQSDGGSAGRLFLLLQTWDLSRTCLHALIDPGLTRALATGGIQYCLCVGEEDTDKGLHLMRLAICEEEMGLSIPNKTHHYAMLGPLVYANRWKEEVFYSSKRKLCCGWTGKGAADRVVCCVSGVNCTAEL